MSCRLWRARSGSLNPVALSAVRLARRTRRRPVIARREELPERPMDGSGDRPVLRLELADRARRQPLEAGAARQAPERLRIIRQRVGLQLVEDLEPVLDR